MLSIFYCICLNQGFCDVQQNFGVVVCGCDWLFAPCLMNHSITSLLLIAYIGCFRCSLVIYMNGNELKKLFNEKISCWECLECSNRNRYTTLQFWRQTIRTILSGGDREVGLVNVHLFADIPNFLGISLTSRSWTI